MTDAQQQQAQPDDREGPARIREWVLRALRPEDWIDYGGDSQPTLRARGYRQVAAAVGLDVIHTERSSEEDGDGGMLYHTDLTVRLRDGGMQMAVQGSYASSMVRRRMAEAERRSFARQMADTRAYHRAVLATTGLAVTWDDLESVHVHRSDVYRVERSRGAPRGSSRGGAPQRGAPARGGAPGRIPTPEEAGAKSAKAYLYKIGAGDWPGSDGRPGWDRINEAARALDMGDRVFVKELSPEQIKDLAAELERRARQQQPSSSPSGPPGGAQPSSPAASPAGPPPGDTEALRAQLRGLLSDLGLGDEAGMAALRRHGWTAGRPTAGQYLAAIAELELQTEPGGDVPAPREEDVPW